MGLEVTVQQKCVLHIINKILLAMNNKLTVCGMLCDLEKSFDWVNHNILLSKQEFYRIVGKFEALIKSYLTERY